MLTQPGREGLGRPIRQQIHDPVCFQIHEDCRIGLPTAAREVVHAEDADGAYGRERQRMNQAHQGRGADRRALGRGVTSTRRATHSDGVAEEMVVQPLSAARPRHHQGREPLSEDTAATRGTRQKKRRVRRCSVTRRPPSGRSASARR